MSQTGVERIEALTEALKAATAPGGEDFDRALDVLDRLKMVDITEDALRKTGLNTLLNTLRKHSNATLVKQAKETVSAFKAALGIGEKRKGPESPSVANNGTTGSTAVPSPTPKEETSCDSNSNEDYDKKRVRVDKDLHVEVSEHTAPPTESPSAAGSPHGNEGFTPGGHQFKKGFEDEDEVDDNIEEYKLGIPSDSARSKMQSILHDALGKDFPASLRIEIAVKIEAAIFRFHGEPNGGSASADYRNQVRVVVANLRDADNPDINRRLLSGEVSPSHIARMSESDMASDALKEQREKTERFSLDSRRSDWDKENAAGATDEFKCHKCKKRKCTYYQRQTRSADEPMTTFITCLECGYRWREY